MSTICRSSQQIVISLEEMQDHYCFRLRQVGFPGTTAAFLATLMVKAPQALNATEESRIQQVLVMLENQKLTLSLKAAQRGNAQKQPVKD